MTKRSLPSVSLDDNQMLVNCLASLFQQSCSCSQSALISACTCRHVQEKLSTIRSPESCKTIVLEPALNSLSRRSVTNGPPKSCWEEVVSNMMTHCSVDDSSRQIRLNYGCMSRMESDLAGKEK